MTDWSPRAQALAEHVVSLPELLTNILEQLDQRTLLCSAPRVCRDWRDLVTSSVDIQRRLFFKPVAAPPRASPSALPLVDHHHHHPDSQQDNTDADPPARLNPLLAEIFRPLFQERNSAARRAFDEIFCCTKALSSSPLTLKKHTSLLRPSASWRRMLTQQPPVYRIGVWCMRQGGGNPTPGQARPPLQPYRVAEYPDGLRMGELYDLCLSTVEEPVLSFRPYWFPRRVQLVDPDEDAPLDGAAVRRLPCFVDRTLRETLRADAAAMAILVPAPGASSAEEGGDRHAEDEPPSQVDALIRLYQMGLLVPQSSRKLHLSHMNQFRITHVAA